LVARTCPERRTPTGATEFQEAEVRTSEDSEGPILEKSSQPTTGYDYDTFAADLHPLIGLATAASSTTPSARSGRVKRAKASRLATLAQEG
jgi:hypothetical protein